MPEFSTTPGAPAIRNSDSDRVAFPRLDANELKLFAECACRQIYRDGEIIFKAGQADVDLFVVEKGRIDITNPTDGDRLIVVHLEGEFAGDIDLLTRRPVIVSAIARGPETVLLRVANDKIHDVLNTIPRLGEKLITAMTVRREQLQRGGVLGLKVVGPGRCKDTTVVREFLYKNFVPFTWFDTEKPEGKRQWELMGSPKKTPAIECPGETELLLNPPLLKLSQCARIWRGCPEGVFDLAVIGAGPAGIAAAVYAASEGLRTVVLDRLGPGGQVGGSSLVENFIGFPAGLSGAELATRGVLQMLKFGAKMVAPVSVEKLIPKPDGSGHSLILSCGQNIDAQVVLVATGMHWRKLDVPGAEKYERQGIYYACTSVEAFLHRGQEVAVIGAGNSAGQAAIFLAEQCAKKVHLLVRREEFGASMSDYLAARIRAQHNIEVHTGTEVSQVHGGRLIERADLKHKNGSTSSIPVTAIFVFIGAEPHGSWLPDSVARDSLGYLLCGTDAQNSGRWPLKDREPCPLETTLPRVLAGGDVRSGSTKRVGFAVGDGSLAVTCVHHIRAAAVPNAPTVSIAPAGKEGIPPQRETPAPPRAVATRA